MELKRYGAEDGMDWVFTSADSPWQNGCSESLVKSTKRCRTHAIGEQILSFSELQTVFFEVANILNERPVGRHPTDAEESYTCPTARASNIQGAIRTIQGTHKPKQRLELLELVGFV